VRCIAAEGVV
jgi:8-oxo-dGTP pyrophosphatase MutT (NUDIX family)